MNLLKRRARRLAWWSPLDWALLAVAMAFLVGAAVRGVSAARGAARLGPVSPADVPSVAPLNNLLPHVAPELLTATVSTDPFRADRSAPPTRYRPSDPNGGVHADEEVSRPPIRDYVLKGIAEAGGLRLALISESSGRPDARIYRPGESIDGFRVKSVAGDSVVLSRADTTIVLKIVRPWTPR